MESRLPEDAATAEGRHEYLATRARQLAACGYKVLEIMNQDRDNDGLAIMVVEHENGGRFCSVYLSPGIRGRGALKEAIAWMELPVVTIAACGISGYLAFNDIDHIVETGPFDSIEYALIEDHYGDRKAKRSDVWLMNHIDEGLAILAKLEAPAAASAIFCLHPLVQNDGDLTTRGISAMAEHPTLNWKGALEYREIANAYLAHRDINDVSEIALGDNSDVRLALIADKVQNYKDFMLYHYGSHKDSDRLFDYFHNWFTRLKLSAKCVIDLLNTLFDNDYMKSITPHIREHRIPAIILHTRIERENRT